MKRMLLCLLLALSALPPAGLRAQKGRQQQQKDTCFDTAHTQLELNECADKDYKTADAALNRVYNQLAAKLSNEEKAKLKEVELNWLKYRDANCTFEADAYAGGSIAPFTYSNCLARMTRTRTDELREQLKDREN
ncbi:MAG TPA: lysozyme inhibitor LprI family protein [Pyrinomonadaceae bacterium]